MEPILLVAISLFIILGWLTVDIALGSRRLGSLGDIAPTVATDAPLVSLIVPACNEAETIAPALATLLA